MWQIVDFANTELAYYEWKIAAAEKENPGAKERQATQKLSQNKNKEIRGIVQISHGMVEHLGRYEPLAKYLNSQGFVVVGADHRGHGHSVNRAHPLGDFGENAKWQDIVNDLADVHHETRARYGDELPYFFIGHSMGSFLLRDYLTQHSPEITGAAIIGTGGWPGFIGECGLAIARIFAYFAPRKSGKLLNLLTFGSYNKNFSGRTKFDWLSRDEAQVDKYLADPLCGIIPTNSFFCELLSGVKKVNCDKAFQLPQPIPLYFAAGELDPVGGEKFVPTIARKYRMAGMPVETKIYPKARHEIFNEINREEVFSDLSNWLCQHSKQIETS